MKLIMLDEYIINLEQVTYIKIFTFPLIEGGKGVKVTVYFNGTEGSIFGKGGDGKHDLKLTGKLEQDCIEFQGDQARRLCVYLYRVGYLDIIT
ncbi:MAG: hypothetical protein WCS37_20060 [Chloroflexota bacterium]|nr:hypothetical protein [Chloroflexota bacterium]